MGVQRRTPSPNEATEFTTTSKGAWEKRLMHPTQVFKRISQLQQIYGTPEFVDMERQLLYDVLSAIAAEPARAQELAAAAKNLQFAAVLPPKERRGRPKGSKTRKKK